MRVLSRLLTTLLVLTLAGALGQSAGCGGCGATTELPPSDGGDSSDGSTDLNPMSITFIAPKQGELVHGQITVVVEVLDKDGIQEVEFFVNDEYIGRRESSTPDSTPDRPRFSVDFATYLQPRGHLSLSVRATDRRGNRGTAIIQVVTRERWAASFGVGHVTQMKLHSDGKLFTSIFRSEEELARSSGQGKHGNVGATLYVTTGAGTALWRMSGKRERFTDFGLDKEGRTYFGATGLTEAKNRLLSLNREQVGQERGEVEGVARWSTDLGAWQPVGAPVLAGDRLLVRLDRPGSGTVPARSVVGCFAAATGKELWRFPDAGGTGVEILRGPFVEPGGKTALIVRPAGSKAGTYSAVAVGREGKQAWTLPFTKLIVGPALQSRDGRSLYVGLEKLDSSGSLEAAAVVAIDLADGNQRWRKENGPRRAVSFAEGTLKGLAVGLRTSDPGVSRVLFLEAATGVERWSKDYNDRKVVKVYSVSRDGILVMSELYEGARRDPAGMELEWYLSAGGRKWAYSRKAFAPKLVVVTPAPEERVFFIVRNLEDPKERNGSLIFAITNAGKRLYTYSEEGRRYDEILAAPPDAIYVSSYDPNRDPRIHVISRK